MNRSFLLSAAVAAAVFGTGHGATAQSCVHYKGLKVSPLGSAQLFLSDGGAKLVVSNIGSSGLDGVRVELPPNTRGWTAGFDPMSSASLPVGAFMASRTLDATSQVLATSQTLVQANNLLLSIDLSALGWTDMDIASTCLGMPVFSGQAAGAGQSFTLVAVDGDTEFPEKCTVDEKEWNWYWADGT